MNRFIDFIIIMFVLFLCSCNKSEVEEEINIPTIDEDLLDITTDVTNSFITDSEIDGFTTIKDYFKNGDKVGIFALSSDEKSPYLNDLSMMNVMAYHEDKKWKYVNPITLNKEQATLYGYYPYEEGQSVDSIAIDTKTEIDYLYTGKSTTVNAMSSKGKLTFNHVLTQLQVNFRKEDYKPKIGVTEIYFRSCKGKNSIPTKGYFSCRTGKVTVSDEEYGSIGTSNVNISDIPDKFKDSNIRNFITMPQTINEGEVEIVAKIGGIDCVYTIPAGTKWEQGMRYVYNITFTVPKIDVTLVTICSWINTTVIPLN